MFSQIWTIFTYIGSTLCHVELEAGIWCVLYKVTTHIFAHSFCCIFAITGYNQVLFWTLLSKQAREGRRLKEFLEDYDDLRDDPKFYK